MKVQIIVPAINLWEKYTKPCIESIQVAMVAAKAHNIECRLLFIDNGSSDLTSIKATKMVNDLFAHKRNEERWGFQKSVNFGVLDAWNRGYDLALVCNNDIVIHPEAIWRLAERFQGGPFVDKDGDEWPVGMVTAMDVRGEVLPSELDQLNANEKSDCPEAAHPNFSAFMLSKEAWGHVGAFDEVFFPAYYEDNDYHYRMDLAGIAAIVLPTALFYHYGSATQNEANEDGRPLVSGSNNQQEFVKKWGGLPGHEVFEHPYNDETKDLSEVINSAEC